MNVAPVNCNVSMDQWIWIIEFNRSKDLDYTLPPPHNGRTVAPEAILFESPCRAHPET